MFDFGTLNENQKQAVLTTDGPLLLIAGPGTGKTYKRTEKTAATGIAEFDVRIGEGILEWIQVSPEYRNRGLGAFVVNELLYRMQGKAGFVTVFR